MEYGILMLKKFGLYLKKGLNVSSVKLKGKAMYDFQYSAKTGFLTVNMDAQILNKDQELEILVNFK